MTLSVGLTTCLGEPNLLRADDSSAQSCDMWVLNPVRFKDQGRWELRAAGGTPVRWTTPSNLGDVEAWLSKVPDLLVVHQKVEALLSIQGRY